MANQQIVSAGAKPVPTPVVVQPTAKVETPQVVQLVVGKPEQADDGMSGLDFTASIVAALAWPVAAVIIAAIFHKQIGGLLVKIRKLNWGDASVELADQLDKVEDNARVLEAEATLPPAVPETQQAPDDRFDALLAISPSAAILDAWRPVERKLIDLGQRHFGNNTKYTLPHLVAEKLAANGHLMSSVVAMVNDLRKIRNDAAHSKEVSVTDAIRFNQLASQVMSALSKI